MITAYVSGQELWWYQSTIVFYAIALFGLVLLIKEGVDAFNNVMRYGRHPDKSEWESIGDSPRTEPVRTYHEPE
jgi:hypothetical protein